MEKDNLISSILVDLKKNYELKEFLMKISESKIEIDIESLTNKLNYMIENFDLLCEKVKNNKPLNKNQNHKNNLNT